ncbi:GNAT family N-acetyltransferase [Trinickia terrae]|uniref:GNAT family N-acetyltransferase n=1 Tax=Trinickia terrae TaxID=2571161 RepID=A0A4U1I5W9_9BURK|nr:GNAT family N-acetyltransferase [Trinickia terrae]TKC88647.1 GNAT family N-acetyltransferase [Trinickia terrae]
MSDHHMLYSICSVPAERVLSLRSEVLLDGNAESSRFVHDDEVSTLHLAVCEHEEIVAVATVCREALPGSTSAKEWRLRGVAVEPRLRGYGFGRLLIKLCLDHVQKEGGRTAWCTARESARGFYEALGFASSAPPFQLPSRGDVLFHEMQYVLSGEAISDTE